MMVLSVIYYILIFYKLLFELDTNLWVQNTKVSG